MADIILKDLYGAEQTYQGVTELALPTADGGTEWYIERPADVFVLHETDYEPSGDSVIATGGVGPLFGGGEINLMMMACAPVEGVSQHAVIVLVSTVDGVRTGYFYLYETLTGEQLLAVLGNTNDSYAGTAQPGWNIVESVDGVDTLRHMDDPESVTVSLPHPYSVIDAAAFYSFLSPAGQENKEVTLTQNGTVEISPTPGSSGLRSVLVRVNVEGGESVANAITAADVTAMLASAGVVEPVAVEDNLLLTDSQNDIYIL